MAENVGHGWFVIKPSFGKTQAAMDKLAVPAK
jgi:hypothetical protein